MSAAYHNNHNHNHTTRPSSTTSSVTYVQEAPGTVTSVHHTRNPSASSSEASSSHANQPSLQAESSRRGHYNYRGPRRELREIHHSRRQSETRQEVRAPPPAPTTTSQRQMRVQYDAISAFFGGGGRVVDQEEPLSPSPLAPSPSPPPMEMHTSRGYARGRRSMESSRASSEAELAALGFGLRPGMAQAPPPYGSRSDMDVESLPSYSLNEYDAELNKKMFIYGFIFFPLWIAGIIAPFIKPYRDPTRDNKTKEQADEEDAQMRKIEMKWAWRCFFALMSLITAVTVAVVVGVTVSR